ncbi:hypothetical protein NDU88_010650 [Pleurodeles waltl]|uniref:Uncharacterized protein n=1 Tax=Pleurodeles waltl TaxID=8319 RepID=A0AAV7S384_PLEWA|nr:hypothetical protein NDU88_010650 [Pleurodeles waltl]
MLAWLLKRERPPPVILSLCRPAGDMILGQERVNSLLRDYLRGVCASLLYVDDTPSKRGMPVIYVDIIMMSKLLVFIISIFITVSFDHMQSVKMAAIFFPFSSNAYNNNESVVCFHPETERR